MKLLRWFVLLLFKLLGWKFIGSLPKKVNKAVLIIAPHTSNWDGFYGLLFCFLKQLPIRFAIKQEAMGFPFGKLLQRMGAIPIDRKSRKVSKSENMVQHMTAILQKRHSLLLIIAPEGTRHYVKRWKQGFYHIAVNARVPIVLGILDYQKKHIGFGPVFYPTGNLAEDLPRIQNFYSHTMGKYPAKSMA